MSWEAAASKDIYTKSVSSVQQVVNLALLSWHHAVRAACMDAMFVCYTSVTVNAVRKQDCSQANAVMADSTYTVHRNWSYHKVTHGNVLRLQLMPMP